jgi:hypothetical protein
MICAGIKRLLCLLFLLSKSNPDTKTRYLKICETYTLKPAFEQVEDDSLFHPVFSPNPE